ncbi:Methionine--tRNA ligase, cytoplasmic, partial [Araneus ventricosus]
DTYFSWNDLMLKINSELLNNLGNFINRALSFISNNFDGCIPEMPLEEGDKKVIAQVDHELKSYIQCMERTRLRDAIKYMLNISRIGNQYIQSNKPWEKIKASAAEKARAGTVLGLSANICCLLCTLMEPYMPDSCSGLKSQLNTQPVHHILVDNFVCLLPSGHKIGKVLPTHGEPNITMEIETVTQQWACRTERRAYLLFDDFKEDTCARCYHYMPLFSFKRKFK